MLEVSACLEVALDGMASKDIYDYAECATHLGCAWVRLASAGDVHGPIPETCHLERWLLEPRDGDSRCALQVGARVAGIALGSAACLALRRRLNWSQAGRSRFLPCCSVVKGARRFGL